MSPIRLSDDQRRALREAARDVPADARRAFIEERARILGVHPSTIYRVLQPTVRERTQRHDTGSSRMLDEDAIMDLAALTAQADYDAELAVDTLNANRVRAGQEPLDIHPETLRRHLRQLGVSRRDNAKDLRVHRRFEAPHPGYLFQIDSTAAACWYIDDDDTIGYEAAVRRNKNKAGNGKPRVWMLGAIDDYSRVRWARFYTANDATAWLDFMLRCWRGLHSDPVVWPAYGVPQRVYSDQDAAMKSAIVTRALELLEVERILARPSDEHWTNAQAKGKVEATIRIVQTFEKISRAKRYGSLEAMNEGLLSHLVWLNNRVHSETRRTPFQRWLDADEVVLLPPPEITRRLSYREVERVISSDVSIRLEGKVYQLPRRAPFVDHIGKRVPVRYLGADLSTIQVVLDGQEHEVGAVERLPDVAGDFKQAPTPRAVRIKKELIARDLSHIDPTAVLDYRTARSAAAHPIRPAERPHPVVTRSLDPPTIKRGKAIDRAQRAGVIAAPPSDMDRAALDRLFAGRSEIPEDELQQWITARRDARGGTDARAQRA